MGKTLLLDWGTSLGMRAGGFHNSCPCHNFAIFGAISILCGMCFHNDKMMCHIQPESVSQMSRSFWQV